MNALQTAIDNANQSEVSNELMERATMYATIAIAQSLAEIAKTLTDLNERADYLDERSEARRIYG